MSHYFPSSCSGASPAQDCPAPPAAAPGLPGSSRRSPGAARLPAQLRGAAHVGALAHPRVKSSHILMHCSADRAKQAVCHHDNDDDEDDDWCCFYCSDVHEGLNTQKQDSQNWFHSPTYAEHVSQGDANGSCISDCHRFLRQCFEVLPHCCSRAGDKSCLSYHTAGPRLQYQE